MSVPFPTSNYADYLTSCAEAVAQWPHLWTFKRDPRYRAVLEHLRPDQAGQFIVQTMLEFPSMWSDIARVVASCIEINDSLGQPVLEPIAWFDDSSPANFRYMSSPANFRYMWHALLILKQLEDMGPWKGHIIEMGGGYGALALYVNRLAHLFQKVEIDSYSIVDLPEPAALQAAFTRQLGVDVVTCSGLDEGGLANVIENTEGERFFFSAYAYSEFHQAMRDWYQLRLMQYMDHGFVVWNFAQGVGGYEALLGGPVYQFVDAPIHTELERPEVDPGLGNLFVTW